MRKCAADRPDVFEITGFRLDRSLDARERRQGRDRLVIVLIDHALATGIRACNAIAGISCFQQILVSGWRCRPRGFPQMLDGEMLIEIKADTRAKLAAAWIIGAAPLQVVA